jgi:hypothetical protein
MTGTTRSITVSLHRKIREDRNRVSIEWCAAVPAKAMRGVFACHIAAPTLPLAHSGTLGSVVPGKCLDFLNRPEHAMGDLQNRGSCLDPSLS